MRKVVQREYRGSVRLVILDWAGTTVDYGCYAPAVVFIEVFRRRGIEVSMDQARRPMGLKKLDHIRAVSRMGEVADLWRQVHASDCTEQDVQDMYEKDFVPLQIACIGDYARLIPGTVEAVDELRQMDIRIGSTTGYFTEASEINQREAERQGYAPDASVCASDVPAGRTEPWMVYRNTEILRIFPPEAVVKVDDTKPGIQEGLNAGTWTIGLSMTGNEVGMNEEELADLSKNLVRRKVAAADGELRKVGAHHVVESIADVPNVIRDIQQRLEEGERP